MQSNYEYTLSANMKLTEQAFFEKSCRMKYLKQYKEFYIWNDSQSNYFLDGNEEIGALNKYTRAIILQGMYCSVSSVTDTRTFSVCFCMLQEYEYGLACTKHAISSFHFWEVLKSLNAKKYKGKVRSRATVRGKASLDSKAEGAKKRQFEEKLCLWTSCSYNLSAALRCWPASNSNSLKVISHVCLSHKNKWGNFFSIFSKEC